jgi:hypothetical protein
MQHMLQYNIPARTCKQECVRKEQPIAIYHYLTGVMNGRTTMPTGTWRKERDQKNAERQQLDTEYKNLKTEVDEAGKIRSSVHTIMAQERRREQPTHKHTHDAEL